MGAWGSVNESYLVVFLKISKIDTLFGIILLYDFVSLAERDKLPTWAFSYLRLLAQRKGFRVVDPAEQIAQAVLELSPTEQAARMFRLRPILL